jgi:flagellar assembly factor FliW
MDINTSRFGRLQFSMAETICFPAGLIGLEDCRSWILISPRPGDRVIWVQSTQQAEIALPLVDPRTFVHDFSLQIEPSDWAPLGKREADLLQVLVTVGSRETGLSLNLLAPLVINCERRIGRQVINLNDWAVDHSLGTLSSDLQRTA